MRKILVFIPIFIFLFSCQKQKQTSIIGGWLEVSAYTERNGQYNWGPATKFPLKLSFGADGKYSAFNDVPAGNGNYSYDHLNKELRIEIFNPFTTSIYTVSYLNDDYLIIDYNPNYKLKFVKL